MKNAKSSLLSIALILALLTTLLSGCGQNQSTDNQQEADTLMPSSTATVEQTVVSISEPTEEPTAPLTAAPTNTPVPEPTSDIEGLEPIQLNSIFMLNYLAVITQEIIDSSNSRLNLEEIYSILENYTKPSAVNEDTKDQLAFLFDTIKNYRTLSHKRERLIYIYQQNQAQALRQAIPNPIGILSAVQSRGWKGAAISAIYMAVDAYTSYKSFVAENDLDYLLADWELDDTEEQLLYNLRGETFGYLVDMTNKFSLPDDLTLNKNNVVEFISIKHEKNPRSRIISLEEKKEEYQGLAEYWLVLAQSYYDQGISKNGTPDDFAKCLEAIETYLALPASILRKDRPLAKVLPMAISAAEETMDSEEYIATAEKYERQGASPFLSSPLLQSRAVGNPGRGGRHAGHLQEGDARAVLRCRARLRQRKLHGSLSLWKKAKRNGLGYPSGTGGDRVRDTPLTLGSLFSGSGGFELAGLLAGMKPVWNSDIEPFAIRVTTKRLPGVRHYGDVSTLNGAELEPVDVITFGSPCQDLSIAGRRAGIQDGARSNLFFQAIRIIREMREATDGKYPRYIVWENVPGAFTSNGGDDFRAVLEAVVGIVEEKAPALPAPEQGRWPPADMLVGDGWSVAYRVLDAQYWGVPQRRKRIFLVADLNGKRAPEILFDSEGLSGYSAARFRAWQRAANGTEAGAGAAGRGIPVINPQGSSGITITEDVTATLVAQDHGHHPAVLDEPLKAAGFLTESSATAYSIGYGEEKSPTLRAGIVPGTLALENNPTDGRVRIEPKDIAQTITKHWGTGGNSQGLVAEPIELQPYGIGSCDSKAWHSDNPKAGIYEADTARTLDQSGGSPVPNQGGIAVVETYSMTTGSFMQVDREVSPPLMARDYKDPNVVSEIEQQPASYRVRRLIPVECARLQGFPDWWCAGLETPDPTEEEIAFWEDVFETYRMITNPEGKPKTMKQIVRWLQSPYTDGAEYRLWGNGVALPVVFFIMAGIAWADGLDGTALS